jgi:hypothetical protein
MKACGSVVRTPTSAKSGGSLGNSGGMCMAAEDSGWGMCTMDKKDGTGDGECRKGI